MKGESENSLRSGKPVRRKSKFASRFCLFSKVKSADCTSGYTPIYLNVYDLTPINGYTYWAGLGIFHTGVEVDGQEYAFGAHDYPTSGIFEVEPRQCPGFQFRKAIFMGTTTLNPLEVREFILKQSSNYPGDAYHLIIKNCNHFCDDICYKLTGTGIPRWVNRLARLGSVCNCILPDSLKVSTVPEPHHEIFESGVHESEKKRLRDFKCFSSLSMPQKEEEVSSVFLYSHFRGCLPPWELTRTRPTLEE